MSDLEIKQLISIRALNIAAAERTLEETGGRDDPHQNSLTTRWLTEAYNQLKKEGKIPSKAP